MFQECNLLVHMYLFFLRNTEAEPPNPTPLYMPLTIATLEWNIRICNCLMECVCGEYFQVGRLEAESVRHIQLRAAPRLVRDMETDYRPLRYHWGTECLQGNRHSL